jgi:hypothetical protein
MLSFCHLEGLCLCSEFECTVWEVLQRKPFQDAKVLAGGNGLSQKVSGACLLEQAQFEEINSGDILITSGSGLNLDAPGGQANIRKMLKKKPLEFALQSARM